MPDEKILKIKELPIMSPVATKILHIQESSNEIPFKELEKIIMLDPAITARILKVSNSALYARQKEITSLQQALTLLGFKTIKSMIMLVCASNVYDKTKKIFEAQGSPFVTKSSAVEMWRHLVLTGFVAREIAKRKGLKAKQEEIFIASLLHDIGRVVLLVNSPVNYKQYFIKINEDPEIDILELEEKTFGYNHLDAGRIVLEKWNFPQEHIDVIANHHSANIDSPYKNSIMVVGLANIFARILAEEPISEIDSELKSSYVSGLKLTDEDEYYFTGQFIEDIQKDEYYMMCMEQSG